MATARFDPAALRAARLRAGLTQLAVAEALGMSSDAVVWRWENGQGEPGPRVFPRLAELLGVPARDLFESVDGAVALQMLRKIAGMTLMDVAGQTGIGYSRYRAIEQYTVAAHPEEIARLAAAFGVTEAEVLRALRTA